MKRNLIVALSLVSLMTACAQIPRPPKAIKLGAVPDVSAAEETVALQTVWDSKVEKTNHQTPKLKPVSHEGIVYHASQKGTLTAFDAMTGSRQFERHLGMGLQSGPVVNDGQLFVTTQKGELLALDAKTGETNYKVAVDELVLAPPAAANGLVVLNTQSGRLIALDAQDGSWAWQVDKLPPSLTLHNASQPVYADGAWLAGFANGHLLAISHEGGQPLYERMISRSLGRSEFERMVDITADMVVSDQSVYASTFQGQLMAFDVRSGAPLWQRPLSVIKNMSLSDTGLFVTSLDGRVVALDKDTGAILWQTDVLSARRPTGPAAVNGYVLVGDHGGHVYAFRQTDGQLVAKQRYNARFQHDPAVSGDMALLISHHGTLTAMRPMEH